jgi:2-polyprenyl-3-methyl-5-hydroxy-6-metoxy-1,4-benzoquinol methylase
MNQHLENTKHVLAKELDPGFARRASIILENINITNGMRTLDVGCGRGFYETALFRLYGDVNITGIDANASYIKLARAHLASLAKHTRISFQKQDATHMDFPSGSFDRIICSEVLEHIDDDVPVIREMYRVMKKGGRGFITVPVANYPIFWDPLNFLLERLFHLHIPSHIWWLAGIWADHVRLYTERELFGKITTAGFVIQDVWRATTWSVPFAHFLLYGVGKNLIEHGMCGKSLDRFDTTTSSSYLTSAIQSFFRIFDRWNDGMEKTRPKYYLNCIVQISK